MSLPPAHAARRAVQKQQVSQLYRHALKNLLSWSVQREVFYDQVDLLRNRFDAHKSETNLDRIDRLIEQGNKTLYKNQHPDPYTIPWSYCGSKYARNPPVPEEIHVALKFGTQEEGL